MNFADKLKEIRRKEGLSQEQLSEKMGVSRQAITKWETGKGLPDIENMIILAEIFKLTLDELVLREIADRQRPEEKFVSETMYDIDQIKCFDIKLFSAKQITIASNQNEKLLIRLESEKIEDLSSMFKVKLEDNGNKLEVNGIKKGGISEKQMGENLCITILLPDNYTQHCEIEANTDNLNLTGLMLERFEYDGDANQVKIEKCSGSIEFAGKTNYNMTIDKIQGKLEITQIKAITILNILEEADFKVESRRKKVKIYWEKNGEECESFENIESKNLLYINGIKSEVIVNLVK